MASRRSYILPIDGEEWRKVPFYEDYLVSNLGRVVNTKTGHLHSPVVRQHKTHITLDVALYNALGRSSVRVAEMVLRAFGDNNPDNTFNYHIVHKDGDYTNCRIDNLEWYCNVKDKIRITQRKGDEVKVYNSWKELPRHYSSRYISKIANTPTLYYGWTWTVERGKEITDNDAKK